MSSEEDSNATDSYAVSGVDRSKLLEVVCMGTPMLVPIETARQIPLLKQRLDSPWFSNEEAPRILLDIPISSFTRVFETMCTGDTTNVLESDLDYFLIDYKKVVPTTQRSQNPTRYDSSRGSESVFSLILREHSISNFHKFTNYFTRDEIGTSTDFYPPGTPYVFRSLEGGSNAQRHSYTVSRSMDFVSHFETQFYLKPDETRSEPLSDDFLEKAFDFAILEINDVIITKIPAWYLFARLEAEGSVRPNEKDVFRYRELSEKKKLALTRRGFTVTILNLFPDLKTRLSDLPSIAPVMYTSSFHIRIERSTFDLEFIGDLVVHPIQVEPKERDRVTRSLFENVIEITRPTSFERSFETIAAYAFVFTVENDVHFDSMSFNMNGTNTKTYTYANLRYDNWIVAGFKRAPRRNVFCFVFSHRDKPASAMSTTRMQESRFTISPESVRVKEACALEYNVLRYSTGAAYLVLMR
jgi:hypothetical protein